MTPVAATSTHFALPSRNVPSPRDAIIVYPGGRCALFFPGRQAASPGSFFHATDSHRRTPPIYLSLLPRVALHSTQGKVVSNKPWTTPPCKDRPKISGRPGVTSDDMALPRGTIIRLCSKGVEPEVHDNRSFEHGNFTGFPATVACRQRKWGSTAVC